MTQETQFSHVSVDIQRAVGFGTEGALHAPEMQPDKVRALGETIRDKFLARVDTHAPGVCMDGRCCAKTMAGTAPVIGPKSAGGPLQTAYAAAELVPGYFGAQSAQDTIGRVNEVGELLAAQGIVIGGHTTEGAINNEFRNPETGIVQTGCGAQEKHAPSTERVAARDTSVMATVDALMGVAHAKITSKSDMEARNSTYNPQIMLDFEQAQNEGKNEEILEGNHKEVAVVWNGVEGTTVDRDALSRELGKDVFVIDAWYIKKIAKAMAIGRPDAEEVYPHLERAMFEYQVATYAELCDGSHPVIVLRGETLQVA